MTPWSPSRVQLSRVYRLVGVGKVEGRWTQMDWVRNLFTYFFWNSTGVGVGGRLMFVYVLSGVHSWWIDSNQSGVWTLSRLLSTVNDKCDDSNPMKQYVVIYWRCLRNSWRLYSFLVRSPRYLWPVVDTPWSDGQHRRRNDSPSSEVTVTGPS